MSREALSFITSVCTLGTRGGCAPAAISTIMVFSDPSTTHGWLIMVYQKTITVRTSGHGDMHDISKEVAKSVAASGITTGTVNVSVVGSTGAVGTIEFEPGLTRDLPEILDKLIPAGRHYGHEQAWHDGNAHSHLQATWLGPSITLPISDSKPVLGMWQQIFFLECDVKPRDRALVATVVG